MKKRIIALTLAVEPGAPGDVSGDGVLNAKDVVAIMRLLTGREDTDVFPEAADFNVGGRVNARDVIALMRAMIGQE